MFESSRSIIITVIVLAVLVILYVVLFLNNKKIKAPYVLDNATCKNCTNITCRAQQVDDEETSNEESDSVTKVSTDGN